MKKILIGLVTTLVFLTPMNQANAEEDQYEFAEEATSAILMERDTGTILFEKNSQEKLPPASMTKIMTMLLIMEALDNEEITWEDTVRVSEKAASMGGSQIFLEPGEEMTVKELMKGIAIASGNDATVAMAEFLAGSEEEFVKEMNQKAKELELENTTFQNTNGLPAANHETSAYDMAVMAKELLKHEEITEYTSLYEDYLRENTDNPFWLVNTNKLVKFYPGADGLKTGFTREAMYCLTASANKDGMRMIAVVMGAPSPKERNRQVTEMFDYAYSQFALHTQHEATDILGEVKVDKGAESSVSVSAKEPVSILMKKGEKTDGLLEKTVWKEDVRAPIQKGDELGTISLERDGETLLSMPLIATEDVEEASFWRLMKRTSEVLFGNAS
ncbi:D-alanyl-D-alanine carboxypeptidase family protein [Salipaludibacillus neizhouensis]|nr:D-alanyl-D-alanine carboxypeptidase family protein [Salipaludibacillus neizhouensis]